MTMKGMPRRCLSTRLAASMQCTKNLVTHHGHNKAVGVFVPAAAWLLKYSLGEIVTQSYMLMDELPCHRHPGNDRLDTYSHMAMEETTINMNSSGLSAKAKQ